MQTDRDAVQRTIESMELTPNRFEIWPADPSNPMENCLKEVRDSELYILLLGDTISEITKAEYYEAHTSLPSRVLIFVRKTMRRSMEAKAFLKEIGTQHSYKKYASIDELQRDVRDGIRSLIFKLLKIDRDAPTDAKQEILFNEEFILEPSEKFYFEFEAGEWDNINGIIDEVDGDPINIYLVSQENYVKMKNRRRFRYYGKEGTGAFSVDYDVEEEGTYYLVIENTAKKYQRELHVKLVRRPFR